MSDMGTTALEEMRQKVDEAMDKAGNPHPNSNAFRAIMNEIIMKIAYEAGYKDGKNEV